MDDVLHDVRGSLLLAADHQPAALEDVDALYTSHGPRLFRFFLFALRDRDAASSLMQDTFLKAWRTRASFRGECAPATWLMRIAVNLLRDYTRPGAFAFWRRASAKSVDAHALADSLPHPAGSAERALLAREQVEILWRAVEALPERQRAVFLLRYVEEMELSEIVIATGLTLPTVKTHLYRALEKVRQQVKKGGEA